MKDPTIGIGTNQFPKMNLLQLMILHKKVEAWQEELGNRMWEDGQGWDIDQLRNDRDYIEELFLPELLKEIERQRPKGN